MSAPGRPGRRFSPGNEPPLGAVLVGGGSRRYGSPKALAPLGGVPMAVRVARAVGAHGDPVVLVGADEALAAELGFEGIADLRPGAGPLAGLEAALERARALGRDGVLVVACDLPLVTGELLGALLDRAEEPEGEGEEGPLHAVLPESGGPVGVEPLCAWYASGALEPVRGLLDRGERSMEGAVAALRIRRLSLGAVEAVGPPGELFLNVNTREERRRAVELLGRPEEAGA